VDEAGYAPADEYPDDVKAHGIEVRLLLGEVLYCEGANGGLLAGGDRLERATEAGPPAQLDLCENESVGSNVQTLTTPELMFRALLTQDGAKRLELARA
jgi:hypothetical protein